MITTKQMKALERLALARGILPVELMENAGREIFLAVKQRFSVEHKRVIIFIGPGNNGGDGLVAARYFAEVCPIVVLFFGTKEKLSEEARLNYDKIKDKVTIYTIKDGKELEAFRFQPHLELVVIDAMLGTGLQGKIRDPISFGIDYFNTIEGIKIAVDVPSGLDPDTGEAGEKVCQADLIVTFHDIKTGLEKLQDKVVVADIGIPA